MTGTIKLDLDQFLMRGRKTTSDSQHMIGWLRMSSSYLYRQDGDGPGHDNNYLLKMLVHIGGSGWVWKHSCFKLIYSAKAATTKAYIHLL